MQVNRVITEKKKFCGVIARVTKCKTQQPSRNDLLPCTCSERTCGQEQTKAVICLCFKSGCQRKPGKMLKNVNGRGSTE